MHPITACGIETALGGRNPIWMKSCMHPITACGIETCGRSRRLAPRAELHAPYREST